MAVDLTAQGRILAGIARFTDRAPRPLLRWVCLVAAAWATGLGDSVGLGLDNTARGIVLAFIGAVYGLRGLEKMKGAA